MKRSPYMLVVVSALAVMVAGAALAAPERPSVRPDPDAFATVTLGAAQLDFEVTAAYERAVVTVSGRGLERTTQRFKAGESISLPLIDKEGSPLADGMYRYNLRIHPRPEKGGGIETGIFYIEGGVAVSREAKRTELAGVRADLNRDRETWMTERMAQMKNAMRELPERLEGQMKPPASKEEFAARQQAMKAEIGEEGSRPAPGQFGGGSSRTPGSELGGGISRPPGPEGLYLAYDGFLIYGFAPEIYFYEYNYGFDLIRMNGGTLHHYGNRTTDHHTYNNRIASYIFDSANRNYRASYFGNFDRAYGNYSRNVRRTYGGYYSGNYDFGSRNVRSAYYGNRDYASWPNRRKSYSGNNDIAYGFNGTNYAFAGYRNMHRAPFNIDIAYYGNTHISGYGNSTYANYGNNFNYAYGYFYNGYPSLYQRGFNQFLSRAWDGGTYTYLTSSLTVQPRGVGVNTLFPTADFEVYDFNDYAALRLNNYNAIWAFSNTPGGSFTVNKIGSGGQEFTVRNRFDASGPTMDVQGSVRGTQFIASSSRELKTDFNTLDGKEVLSKLSEVPVMSWRYKTEDETTQHFGLVAEDFRAAFQLGDGKTISSIDADGVAMAAIQGLHELVQEQGSSLEQQQADVARRDREIAELRETVARLEETLQRLTVEKQ